MSIGTMKIARLIARNVKPMHAHDCPDCLFLGHLGGDDLYVCHNAETGAEYICRGSSGEGDYGCCPGEFVDLTTNGSVYRLAAKLYDRNLKEKGWTPNKYRLVG